MMKKQIIIIVGVILVAAGLTLGGMLLFRMLNSSGQESVQTSSDSNTFNTITGIEALAEFSQLPDEGGGWKIIDRQSDVTFGYAHFVHNTSCSIEFISKRTPYPNSTLSDYELSKQLAESLAAGEQASLEVGDSITVKSSAGDTDFYVGTYNPKVLLKTINTSNASTSVGGTTDISEPYKTFLAVRTIGDTIQSVDSFNTEKTVDDSEYKDGEIQKSKESIPSVVIKYQCKESAYNISDALKFLDQLEINFAAPQQEVTNTSTTGK